ncbi:MULTISPECIES: cysteine--tRNA ligase [Aerococcus]|uniref:Cysteine--tRNA ligase n=1 Tax=Aerococcus sanguinicola TaxID=119206 RepID=A0A5N1GHM8_9LACT|nr:MULTISPECIES: cysteine--tRNA ligase [Aerococcus]KAA9299659.1 cysteine--tRNA ligase [Aerococcus sanguinicola]MDK6369960.1 cysteine--tRNA ligase [Aerococcus sp. UMB9870]MDK6680566.1 cysteine--tRNA ligase [Aerococcus sp. UMB8608]MDK6687396.1 cysteine--tRNA ligase [Aerococcus sp. UMB8623]MDK6940483.1 cysteine--tRNA ligase [Aerococcus sp. UMB8487]
MLKIYNTLTNQKEEFKAIEDGKISMYVCGPTVYNYIHIGNARSVVAFDTIRRYFLYRGYEVNFVSNFTDVDDKIINRANEEGISAKEVADKYIEAYYADTDALNVMRASRNTRVVETMDDIVAFVEDLIAKGFAYELDGDVYYRARRFDHYGRLSDQSIDDLREGASERVGIDSQAKKEDSVDFALWKAAKPGEPSWESPWGQGRPGWHIECSVMATKYLADTIDIHGGGHDLIFPHHENEIAQSEAKTGQPFAHYWMHNGFVTIGDDGEKMSKSLGNFVLAHDLIQEVDPQVIRFFLSSAHYRSPLKFSESSLDDARKNLERLRIAYQNINYRLEDAVDQLADDDAALAKRDQFQADFIQAMDDDINAPNGLTVIYQLMREINLYLEEDQVSKVVLEAYRDLYLELLSIFGVTFAEEKELLDDDIQALIEERDQARANKDYARSDAIRDQLKAEGIILDDTPQGTRWRRSE